MRRIDLDVRVARAAQRAGANLMEGFEVGTEVALDKAAGLWTVKSTDVSVGCGQLLRARLRAAAVCGLLLCMRGCCYCVPVGASGGSEMGRGAACGVGPLEAGPA